MASAYPLEWPQGWQRTPSQKRWSSSQFQTTFDKARRDLNNELRLLGANNVVISSWLPLRQDGQPRADAARYRLEDPGVAVYFTLRKQQMVMARDAYASVHDNLRSIGLGIAALRGLERHGGGAMMERAFTGFAALPAPAGRDPWTLLGVSRSAGRDEISAAYRNLSKSRHPEADGGSEEAFRELCEAKDLALANLPSTAA